MRNTIVAIVAAVAMFIVGVVILNTQLWYSARADSFTGAKYAIKNMKVILDEARHATHTAVGISEKECSLEEQYQLGIEAALQPHLRTIMILRNGKVRCSSLPGNRILLADVSALPDSPLLLVPAKSTVNGLPALLYQTKVANGKVVVSISDRHIRDALNIPLKHVAYSLRVGDQVIGLSGDVSVTTDMPSRYARVESTDYPFSIEYRYRPFFSPHRLFSEGVGILFFLLLVLCLTAYLLIRYLNRNTQPEEALRIAIDRGEIVPFYQPVVNGKEGTLRGVEVLARWVHPDAGIISPSSFIPVAEKSGLIVPLTRSLMAQVSRNMNTIDQNLSEGFHVGINFSASHIASATFVEECLKYKDSFTRRDLNLVIEVTEREPLDIDDRLVHTLNVLHENGFVIALDDFGTGYSGLSYLHDLHIDYIKIDKSFVGRVNGNADSTKILDSVLQLAHKLSISIVAEGVETQEQVDYLNRNNITFLQGYFFYKPVPFDELVKILLSKPKIRVMVE